MDLQGSVDLFRNPDQQQLPYIEFETRATEARGEEGQLISKDVDFVKVTQPGGKDTLEKPVDEWLKGMGEHAKAGRIPPHWAGQLKQAYKMWKEGEEMPLNGYSIKLWAPLLPSQRKILLELKIRTVEELAQANEEVIERIGIGGRSLVQMAQNWLADQKGPGAMAAKLADLEQKLERATELAAKQQETINSLLAFVPEDKRPKTGERPSGILQIVGAGEED